MNGAEDSNNGIEPAAVLLQCSIRSMRDIRQKEGAGKMSVQNSNAGMKKRFRTAHPIAEIFCVVLFVLVGCGPSEVTVERTTDQAKLAKIAAETKDFNVRWAAVEKLTDQAVLAQIATLDYPFKSSDLLENSSLCDIAKKRITDQAVLAKIATNDSHGGWAVEKLTDQAALAKVTVEAKDSDVRRDAVRKLTQASLAKVVVETNDLSICSFAAEKITDKALLAEVGMWVKPEMTKQVTNQGLLAKIAVKAVDWHVRRAALENLTDQVLLAEVGMWVKPELTKQVSDQGLLAKIAVEAKESAVRCAAVEKITDPAVLAQAGKIAEREGDGDMLKILLDKRIERNAVQNRNVSAAAVSQPRKLNSLIANNQFMIRPGETVMVILMLLFVIAMPIFIYRFLKIKRRLRRGRQALAMRQFSEALGHFQNAANMGFLAMDEFKITAASKGNFDQALDGIEQVYRAADIVVDLAPLRELRMDLLALGKDKRYFHQRNACYTEEGQRIRDTIYQHLRERLTSLPSV